MELGALVCTASGPACERCPIVAACAWHGAGRPAYDGPPRRGQRYAGTDRQCRGRLLAVLRDSDGVVPSRLLDAAWPEPVQRARALAGLLDDGLVVARGRQGYSLPG
jgi:A/G-specific adenine glycosylase